MSDHDSFSAIIAPTEGAGNRLTHAFKVARAALADNMAVDVRVKPTKMTRSTAQNNLMWAMLSDYEQQLTVGGQLLDSWQWKAVLSAAWREQEPLPGLAGGLVYAEIRTSKLGVKQMAEFLTFIEAEGIDRGIKFSAPAWLSEKAGL